MGRKYKQGYAITKVFKYLIISKTKQNSVFLKITIYSLQ